MNVEGGDPSGTRVENFNQGLAREVVGSDDALVRDEENWFGRVEVCGLRGTTALETPAEGVLSEVF